jgi:hypothetical protein
MICFHCKITVEINITPFRETRICPARAWLQNLYANRALSRRQKEAEKESTKEKKKPDSKDKDKEKEKDKDKDRPTNKPPYTEDQIAIKREIGNGTHTADQVRFWQAKVGPNRCYFHNVDYHTTENCIQLKLFKRNAEAERRNANTPSQNPPNSQTPNNPQPPKQQRNDNANPKANYAQAAGAAEPEANPIG